MANVLAIGEALVDAISIDFADNLKDAKSFRIQAGGSPANFCGYLKQLGTSANLVAAVGIDGFGAVVLESLREKGLSIDHIAQLEHHATSLIMVSRSAGTPDFLPYRDADRYLPPVEPDLVAAASLVHTTAFALSRQPARSVILEAMESAALSGKTISVDWNYSDKIWRKRKKAEKVFNRVCSWKPLLKFSMDDAQRFLQRELSEDEAKTFLEDLPAKAVCLTCGGDGVWYKEPQNSWKHQAAEQVPVTDATGAGDSFWAGFISAYMQQQEMGVCVQKGMATAARKLQGLPLV